MIRIRTTCSSGWMRRSMSWASDPVVSVPSLNWAAAVS